MNEFHRVSFQSRPAGPIARIVTAIAAAGLLVMSFFLGLVFFAVFTGLALILAVVVGIRVWWVRRSLNRQTDAHGGRFRPSHRAGDPGGHDVFDGEFRVIQPRKHDRAP